MSKQTEKTVSEGAAVRTEKKNCMQEDEGTELRMHFALSFPLFSLALICNSLSPEMHTSKQSTGGTVKDGQRQRERERERGNTFWLWFCASRR